MNRQTINGDNNIQAGGDIDIGSVNIMVKNGLSVATKPIRANLADEPPLTEDQDIENTVLISKLKTGGFNVVFRNHATKKKLDALNIVINYSKKENGKAILNDIYQNLITIINVKYISKLADGESLQSSVTEFVEDFSEIAEKYKQYIEIDEAFLEGLLYIATSRCAINWKMENDDENINDSK